MRLTDHQVEAICSLFIKHFGENAHLWLFGSRVDDNKRGGDIDLYVESPETNFNILFDIKTDYVKALERAIADRHVDVVIKSRNKDLLIDRVARSTGIPLVGPDQSPDYVPERTRNYYMAEILESVLELADTHADPTRGDGGYGIISPLYA